jgi:hypothetical protein
MNEFFDLLGHMTWLGMLAVLFVVLLFVAVLVKIFE